MIGEGGASTWLDFPKGATKQQTAKKRRHEPLNVKEEQGMDIDLHFII